MVISTRPRHVAAPWERERTRGTARVSVGYEADVDPPEGPLALYQSAFPHRYVVWNRPRQLWEIRQTNPVSGKDERVELLFYYDAPPDPETGEDVTPEELAEMIERGSPGLVKCYQPFDYRFVRQRIQELREFLAIGLERQTDRRMARNRKLQLAPLLEFGSELHYFFRHESRWLEPLANQHERGRGYAHERTPLVAGADLSTKEAG